MGRGDEALDESNPNDHAAHAVLIATLHQTLEDKLAFVGNRDERGQPWPWAQETLMHLAVADDFELHWVERPREGAEWTPTPGGGRIESRKGSETVAQATTLFYEHAEAAKHYGRRLRDDDLIELTPVVHGGTWEPESPDGYRAASQIAQYTLHYAPLIPPIQEDQADTIARLGLEPQLEAARRTERDREAEGRRRRLAAARADDLRQLRLAILGAADGSHICERGETLTERCQRAGSLLSGKRQHTATERLGGQERVDALVEQAVDEGAETETLLAEIVERLGNDDG